MLKVASSATISTDYMSVPSNSEPNRLSNSDLIIQQIYKYRAVSVIAYFLNPNLVKLKLKLEIVTMN
jgi:hypothetical protein